MEYLYDFKTVLIIGNGFDKSIGLNTSYSDFMESEIFAKTSSGENRTLMKYLDYQKGSHGSWVDIEKELGNYANAIDNIRTDIPDEVLKKKRSRELRDSFRAEYTDLCSTLKEYLISESFKEPGVESLGTNAYKLIRDLAVGNRPFYTINFNYTNMAEKVIGGFFSPVVRYIHGKLKNGIVFGVQDSLDLKRHNVFLYKSHSQYKNVQGIPTLLNDAKKIVFFGYSLGETDHSYFDDFFKAQTINGCDRKSLVFYYYKQEGYDDLIWELKILTGNRISYLAQYNDIKMIDSSNPI